MKLDVWRDPYKKDAQYRSGELVSSAMPSKKPKKPPVLKYGTGCAAGGPECDKCSLPDCTWQSKWGREIDIRNVEVT